MRQDIRLLNAVRAPVAPETKGNRRPYCVEQADVLAHQQRTDQRQVLAAPARVLGEFSAQSRALAEIAVAPQMHDLIEGADLARPVAFKLAVVILADIARYGTRRLDHVAEAAGLHGVGSQLVDHDVSPILLPLVLQPSSPLLVLYGERSDRSYDPGEGRGTPRTSSAALAEREEPLTPA